MLELAEELKTEQRLLVFGRGYNYATTLEAALKVRPVSGSRSWCQEYGLVQTCWQATIIVLMHSQRLLAEWTKPAALVTNK